MNNPQQLKQWAHVNHMFALIIGIDKYEHASNLKGAARDADRMVSFLREHLKVSHGRIMNLRNEGATRKAITDAFDNLCRSDSIRRGDPILIYFAGHGCTMPRPDSWGAGAPEKIRGIFPHDVQPHESADRTIFPIPDRTIISWLDKISSQKGDNITVIFDTCHYSGPYYEGARFQEFHGNLPSDIDNLTDGIHHEVMRPESRGQPPCSYVMMTACGAPEVAQERDGHGLFTEALLSTLEKPGVAKLSFTKLMRHLPRLHGQKPQLLGQFKDRLLFTTEIQEVRLHNFSVFPREDQRYTIHAGKAHGITIGSVFEVFEETFNQDHPATKVYDTLRVQEVNPFEAIAVLEPGGSTLPQSVVARLVRAGPDNPLYVYFSKAILDLMQASDLLTDMVVPVQEKNADLILELEDMNATFFTNLEPVTKHGFKKLPHVVSAHPEAVSEILLLASRWKLLFNQCSPEHWNQNISLEFFLLERDGNKVDDMGYIVLKRNDSKNLNINNVVDIVINSELNDFYGVEVRNASDKDLYVSLFTFDLSDLSIVSRWTSDLSQGPPLLAGGSLTIGYGPHGGLPLCYELPKGIDIDVGFLKVYLTTKPINLECLEQESPFSLYRGFSSTSDMKMLETEDLWGTVTCTVVQHAYPWGPDPRFEQTVTDQSSYLSCQKV